MKGLFKLTSRPRQVASESFGMDHSLSNAWSHENGFSTSFSDPRQPITWQQSRYVFAIKLIRMSQFGTVNRRSMYTDA